MRDRTTSIALLFPGQGAYSPGLVKRLMRQCPEVDPDLAAIRGVWLAETGVDLNDMVNSHDDIDAIVRQDPGTAQVVLFGASVALHRVLHERLPPAPVYLGHSFGEIAALTCAGAWSIEEGTRVVAARVRALSECVPGDAGAMVALSCQAERAVGLVQLVGDDDLVVAGSNGPGQVVVSGPTQGGESTEAVSRALGIATVRLSSPYPFHSPRMRPVVGPFTVALRAIGWRPDHLPVYSPILGRFYRSDDDLAAAVGEHLVLPFDFGAAVRELHAEGIKTFVECGGRNSLTGAVRRVLKASPDAEWRAVACDTGQGALAEAARRALTGLAANGTADFPSIRGEALLAELLRFLREALRADMATLLRDALADGPRASAEHPSGPVGDTNGGTHVQPEQPATFTPEPDRAALADATETQRSTPLPSAQDQRAANKSDVLDALVELYSEALEYPPEVLGSEVQREAELGVDSVKQTELLVRTAERFGLPPTPGNFSIGDYPTLGQIADLVLELAR
ncbi:acyltransferase domain-containing protein [Streptomyces mirabilis]